MITTPLHKSLVLSAIAILFSLPSFSQVYVDTDAPVNGDGNSWATAYRNLQDGLNLASTTGQDIWVAEGIYTIVGDEDSSFEIPSGVAVYGGFDGTEALESQRDYENNLTSLDGNDYNRTIVVFENSSSSTILDGFIIENGNADGSNTEGRSGGGIYITGATSGNSSPQISNCIIQNNSADFFGGAMLIEGSFSRTINAVFTNCTFDNNTSGGNGGAIYQDGSFSGICNPSYLQCTFTDNNSGGSGGAVFSTGKDGNVSTTFKRCNFEGNSTNTSSSSANGGAMYSIGSSDGEANHDIINCRFYDNHAFAAGAIYSLAGSGDASPKIINSTFVANTVNIAGGGTCGAIYSNAEGGGTSDTEITNCIIWGNIAPTSTKALKNVYASPTISYSLVDVTSFGDLDGGSGSALIEGSGVIYKSGTVTTPSFKDEAIGDLRLSATSPAMDVGDNFATTETEDLDFNSRFVGNIDLGAYEFSALLPVELAFFTATAKEREVLLRWATHTEIDNDYFEVERSEDGRVFTTINKVDGAGNSNTFNHYEITDINPLTGDNYYRLKNVAFDGSIEYSPIRIVKFNATGISIYPNPVKETLQVAFSEAMDEQTSFEVYSIFGQLMFRGNLNVNGTSASINHGDLQQLATGTYLLKIQLSDNYSLTERFQKIK